MNWYLEVIKKYAVFSGRAGRKEYWVFSLISAVIIVVLYRIDIALDIEYNYYDLWITSEIYALATLLPTIAVTVRRLHDAGKSGWMVLVLLIPYLGPVLLFLCVIQRSEKEVNQYGPLAGAGKLG